MASVYYLFDDAKDIADLIIWSTEAKFELDKKRYFAALLIQRTYRGYSVRCEFKKWILAATVIQKNVRGYLLRLHLPEIAAEAFKRKCISMFNKMATKIQALWRGYMVRKCVNIDQILAEKREEQEAHDAIMNFFSNIFKKRQEGESDISIGVEGLTPEAKAIRNLTKHSPGIIQALFDKHHLLRTHQIEGVLSIHNSKELSVLEKFLRQMDNKTYMDNVRKIYKDTQEPEIEYMFRDERARKIEDLLRIKNHREGKLKKEDINKKIDDEGIHSVPFKMLSKVEEKPYEREMMSHEKYQGVQLPVFRDRIKPDISEHEFDLNVRQVGKNQKEEPPYFIDHWKKICCTHNFMYDFMEKKDD